MYIMSALKDKNAYHYIWRPDKLLYFQELLQEREIERGKKKKKKNREKSVGMEKEVEIAERVQKWKNASTSVQ